MRARLETRDGGDQRRLRLGRQRGRNAVGIDGRIVDALRLEEDLMALPIGEADHLVFDRGAIARAAAGDRAGIDRGAVRHPRATIAVGFGRRAGDVAGKLGRRDCSVISREEFRRIVAVLDLEPPPSRWSLPSRRGGVPVFSLPKAKPARSRLSSKRHGRLLAEAPGGRALSPRWIIPRRKVPVVSTTERQAKARPSASATPDTAPFSAEIADASPSTTVRPGVAARSRCMARR